MLPHQDFKHLEAFQIDGWLLSEASSHVKDARNALRVGSSFCLARVHGAATKAFVSWILVDDDFIGVKLP